MAKVKIVLLDRGMRELVHDDGIHEQLRAVGGTIASRAGSEWDVQDWRNPPMHGRKTRTVVNVINTTKGADVQEAKSGKMARILKGMTR